MSVKKRSDLFRKIGIEQFSLQPMVTHSHLADIFWDFNFVNFDSLTVVVALLIAVAVVVAVVVFNNA